MTNDLIRHVANDTMTKPCKKRSFRDKDEALYALHGIANKNDGRKKPVRVYECEDCGCWHLTSKPIGEMMKTALVLTLDWSRVVEPGIKMQETRQENNSLNQ